MIKFCTSIAFLSILLTVAAKMEGYIVGGNYAKIKDYPHCASMFVSCDKQGSSYTQCGSSILNQWIMLTAAHCFEDKCSHKLKTIYFMFGSADNTVGELRKGVKIVIHNKYDPQKCGNDIAMVKLANSLRLNATLGRVAIMRNPPYNEPAKIAGWGATNESPLQYGPYLKQLTVKVRKKQVCKGIIRDVPNGTICASSDTNTEYASFADSGSALVVKGYIQIGIASFKVQSVATNVLFYTDVGYYYDWIEKNSKVLFCVG